MHLGCPNLSEHMQRSLLSFFSLVTEGHWLKFDYPILGRKSWFHVYCLHIKKDPLTVSSWRLLLFKAFKLRIEWHVTVFRKRYVLSWQIQNTYVFFPYDYLCFHFHVIPELLGFSTLCSGITTDLFKCFP